MAVGLGLGAEAAPAPALDRLVALDGEDGLVGLAPKPAEPPLLIDALVSMNDVVPVALALVRGVRDVPLVELVDDVLAPVVPVTPACSPEVRHPVSVIGGG